MGGTQIRTTTTETHTRPVKPPAEPVTDTGSPPGRGWRMPGFAAGRTAPEHALMAEFLVALVLIALRACADYVPADDESKPGSEQPSTGAHPLTMLAATLLVYFVLSLGARSGAWLARACVMFGALIDVTLLVNSRDEFETVTGWFDALSPESEAQ